MLDRLHGPLAYELRMACMRLTRRVRYDTSTLAPHFLAALSAVQRGDASTAADLASLERVSAPSMSRTVRELEERGLMTRTQGTDDKRCQILALTPSGVDAVDEGRRVRDQWMLDHLSDCTPEELDTLERATVIINRLVER
ncbi:MAG TPA: MarR family transcriptional regulator [Propionibacteriaceae bacterium]|nr:MarR family transcriptional regulator [Propionibacteriaceae bacterium]